LTAPRWSSYSFNACGKPSAAWPRTCRFNRQKFAELGREAGGYPSSLADLRRLPFTGIVRLRANYPNRPAGHALRHHPPPAHSSGTTGKPKALSSRARTWNNAAELCGASSS